MSTTMVDTKREKNIHIEIGMKQMAPSIVFGSISHGTLPRVMLHLRDTEIFFTGFSLMIDVEVSWRIQLTNQSPPPALQ
jgi:hypothetical protein